MGSKRHGAIAPTDGECSPQALDFITHFPFYQCTFTSSISDITISKLSRQLGPRGLGHTCTAILFSLETHFASQHSQPELQLIFVTCTGINTPSIVVVYGQNYIGITYIGTGTCLQGREIVHKHMVSLSGSRNGLDCSTQLPTLA